MSEPGGMSPIVRIVTRWLLGFVLVFGFAVALFGHLTPGGGFAGGVVITCGFVLATLAFGAKTGPAAWFGRLASTLDAVGALAFLALALLGYAAGHFLAQWAGRDPEPFRLTSAPSLVLLNLAILLKVGAGLFAGFLAVAAFGRAAEDVGTDEFSDAGAPQGPEPEGREA
ncbi:MAG: MnhB domain-containing protein [Planctomycetes bacterium]|nr:MnhB domain-containing protein [Planctomycetota bacterium]